MVKVYNIIDALTMKNFLQNFQVQFIIHLESDMHSFKKIISADHRGTNVNHELKTRLAS